MKRTEFGKVLLGLAGLSMLSGCRSRIGKSAYDTSLGDPYRCSRCGHLIRSTEDMTDRRCPRCYARKLTKMSEEEMKNWLNRGE